MKRDSVADLNRATWRWANCPELRDAFIGFARREVEAGRRFGAQEIAERLRWNEFVGQDGEGFRLNNALVAAYVRLLIRDFPECRPFVTLRRSRFDALMEGVADER